jgi:drug/metabolite transporter (DMT)-like permease
MWFALLTAVLWSGSGICSARAGGLLGVLIVNRSRLMIALLGLGVVAWLLGSHLQGPGAVWFVISGVVGLGLGDISMYAAYRHLGTRLTILMTQALAVPGAWLVEWLWLGGDPQLARAPWAGVVMIGLAFALWPSPSDVVVRNRRLGILFGIGSALGLTAAAVLSRRGYAAGTIDGMGAAVLRNAGGLGMMLLFWPLEILVRRARRRLGVDEKPQWRRAWPWLLGSAVLGPGVGVACYQTALSHANAGAVQAVVATTPVLIIPLAWALDGDRPHWRGIAGAIIAVLGVIGMVW